MVEDAIRLKLWWVRKGTERRRVSLDLLVATEGVISWVEGRGII
jgi:hypothetical protein